MQLPNIPSPCVGVCQLDDQTGFCKGCLRTSNEIAIWRSTSNAERYQIVQDLRDRRRAMGRTSAADQKPRRRKRRGKQSGEYKRSSI
ncbi:MAG: DUF1289 domain-containing protein [Pseudomonadota bacterium]